MIKALRLTPLLCLAACLSQAAPLQKSGGTKAGKKETTRSLTHDSTGEDARAEYEGRQSDGVRLTLYRMKDGAFVTADPEQPFRSGDRIKLRFESNFDGYVYVVNVTPGGESRLLFPYPNRNNRVRAGQRYELPRSGEFAFDREPGVEVLQVIISREPVTFLEAALEVAVKKSNNALDPSTIKLMEYLTGKAKRRKEAGVFRYEEQASKTRGVGQPPARARSLTLDPGKEDTVLILPGKKGTPGRFKPGEVSVFEIRLRHL